MIEKSLLDLSLNISEELYREMPALSYSTLARYEKGGFSSIPKLYDSVESEAITFGSMVDCIITESSEAFNKKFALATDDVIPSESIKNVIDSIPFTENTLDEVSDEAILIACNINSYQTNWKDSTRVNKIRELGTAYYDFIRNVNGRKVVPYSMYSKALEVMDKLKDTFGEYFKPHTSYETIEYLYQTKFSRMINGMDFKSMMDLIIVNHDKKVIIPIDLKTTSVPEYDFPKKYLENRYDIQSRLYSSILNVITNRDEYFREFSILPFRFIVINKDTLNPLMFVDEKCRVSEDIEVNKSNGIKLTLRNPFKIALELKEYLDSNATVPNYIDKDGLNNIHEILNLV